MKIKYKRIKIPVEHCGDCGERLSGNGSGYLPWKCSCGTWEYQAGELFELKLKKANDNN